jgi:hypothetical protein
MHFDDQNRIQFHTFSRPKNRCFLANILLAKSTFLVAQKAARLAKKNANLGAAKPQIPARVSRNIISRNVISRNIIFGAPRHRHGAPRAALLVPGRGQWDVKAQHVRATWTSWPAAQPVAFLKKLKVLIKNAEENS